MKPERALWNFLYLFFDIPESPRLIPAHLAPLALAGQPRFYLILGLVVNLAIWFCTIRLKFTGLVCFNVVKTSVLSAACPDSVLISGLFVLKSPAYPFEIFQDLEKGNISSKNATMNTPFGGGAHK